MRTLINVIASLSLFAAAGFAQPTITQVSNAASESLSVAAPETGWLSLPNSSIAQGSYFTIYGNGFGGNTSVWNPYPLPTMLNNTSVSITVGQNAPVAAYIEFAAQFSAYSQVNAILPSNTPVGGGTLVVTYNGQASPPAPINVVASSFGAFSQNEAGDGPGIITDAGYNKFTPYHTAKPGQTVILWGTGLGPAPDPATEATKPPAAVNECAVAASCPVTLWVGNIQANVVYAGRSGYTGEDEIVFVVPSNVTPGCNVSVALQTGAPGGAQITGNFTSMSVDPTGTSCNDADGVNMSDLASVVQSKGSAKVASIGLLSQAWNINLNAGGVFVQWQNDSVDGQIGTFDLAALELFRGFTRVPSVNSCIALPYTGYPPPVDYGLGYVTYLDAGSQLTIQGPLGTQPVPKNSNGNGYDAVVGGSTTTDLVGLDGLVPFYWNSTDNGDGSFDPTSIATGNYMVSAPGGTAVSAFTGTLDIPSAATSFVWTNASTYNGQNATVIPRNASLNITWTGGDPQGFVDITMISSTVQNSYPSTKGNPEPAVYAECIVPTSKLSFEVPSYVLQALPQTVFNGTPSNSFVAGVLLVGQTGPVTKISPPPTGLDAAYLYYRIISGYTVQWQ